MIHREAISKLAGLLLYMQADPRIGRRVHRENVPVAGSTSCRITSVRNDGMDEKLELVCLCSEQRRRLAAGESLVHSGAQDTSTTRAPARVRHSAEHGASAAMKRAGGRRGMAEVRATGIEPMTARSGVECSTTELSPRRASKICKIHIYSLSRSRE